MIQCPHRPSRNRGASAVPLLMLAALLIGVALVLWWSATQLAPSLSPEVQSLEIAAVQAGEQLSGGFERPISETSKGVAAESTAKPTSSEREIVPVIEPAGTNTSTAFTIRAIDERGMPLQGIEVEWVFRNSSDSIGTQAIQGQTDAQGLLSIPDSFDYREIIGRRFDSNLERPSRALSAIGIRCNLPFEEPTYRGELSTTGLLRIEHEPQADQILDLVLPPMGWVEFQFDSVLDGLGRPLQPESLRVDRIFESGIQPTFGFVDVDRASNIRFGPIGLNWTLYAICGRPGLFAPLGQVVGSGPTKAGETAILRLSTTNGPLPLALLRGSAQNEDGVALVETELTLKLIDPPEDIFPSTSLHTDRDGRWELNIPRAWLTREVMLSERDNDRKPRGTPELDISRPDQLLFDLGAVTLRPTLPPKVHLVSGRIVDTQGQPIVEAYVRIEARFFSKRGQEVGQKESGEAPWTMVGFVLTDADGRFAHDEIIELASSVLRITATHQRYQNSAPLEVNVGSDGVELVLDKGAEIKLRLLADWWLRDADVLRFQVLNPERKPLQLIDDIFDSEGATYTGLLPGDYALRVWQAGGDWTLLEQSVTLQANESVDLGSIDLRDAFRVGTLLVVDSNGEPWSTGTLSLREVGTDTLIQQGIRPNKQGYVDVLVPHDAGDVTLSAYSGPTALLPASLFLTPTAGTEPAPVTITLAD